MVLTADTKAQEGEMTKAKRGRKPVPPENKRRQVAARVKPNNYTWLILFKQTLDPDPDNSFNDQYGKASIGRAIDKMVEMLIDAGVTREAVISRMNDLGISLKDVLTERQITAKDIERLEKHSLLDRDPHP